MYHQSKYSSASANNNQPRLAQLNPPFPCVDARRFVQLTDKSREQGGHLIRCRRRRCSLECAQAGAAQLNACLAARLLTVTSEVLLTHNTKSNLTGNATPLCHSFRGHLTFPKGSSPADHRAAKTRFLDNLRNARKRLGCVLEIHCNLHLTSLTEGHYDYLAFSDLDEPDLRRVIRESWFGRDGEIQGFRYALVAVAKEYLRAATTYHAKAVVPKGDDRLLPVAKGEPGYLEATWATAGFWGDSSLEKTWKSLCDQWFPSEDPGEYQHGKKYQPDQDLSRDPVSHRLQRAFDPPHPGVVDPFDPTDRHQSRLDRIARLIAFASDLPADVDDRQRFGERWRLNEHWIDWDQVQRVSAERIRRQIK